MFPCALVDADPALPACLHANHTFEVTAAAGATATAGDDGALSTLAVRGDVSYTLAIGRDVPVWALVLAAGATATRDDGLVDAFGGSTRLSLSLDPVNPPDGDTQRAHIAPFPLSFEIEHDGELDALPRLSDAADVARKPLSREHVEARTRALRFALAADHHPDPHDDKPAVALDLFPAHGEIDATYQDGTRVATTGGGAFLGVTDTADAAYANIAEFDVHHVALPDGTSRDWNELWLLRAHVRSPLTGTDWQIGWGVLDDPLFGKRNLFAIAAGDLDDGAIGYTRTPYVTMMGAPAIEDRFGAERKLGPVVAQVFAARTDRLPGVDWTAGVAATASRRVGAVDVGLRTEIGRSFYATLDDGSPSAGFGARVSLTISRAVAHRF